MIEQSRRGFITGLVSLIAAPAIVRVGSIMPVKAIPTNMTATEIVNRQADYLARYCMQDAEFTRKIVELFNKTNSLLMEMDFK